MHPNLLTWLTLGFELIWFAPPIAFTLSVAFAIFLV